MSSSCISSLSLLLSSPSSSHSSCAMFLSSLLLLSSTSSSSSSTPSQLYSSSLSSISLLSPLKPLSTSSRPSPSVDSIFLLLSRTAYVVGPPQISLNLHVSYSYFCTCVSLVCGLFPLFPISFHLVPFMFLSFHFSSLVPLSHVLLHSSVPTWPLPPSTKISPIPLATSHGIGCPYPKS